VEKIFSSKLPRARGGGGAPSPHIQSVPGLKRPGREVDHLTPSSAVFMNEWKCKFTLIVRLYGGEQ